ncbi:HD domain-containing protein [Infirmifilum sp.]|uniref:HD domain-containing protein n=1 Tax=Infirmifilum sp. TaxID=2856575 RepID=UPI003D15233F
MTAPWDELVQFCQEFGNYLTGYQRRLFPYFVLHDHVHAWNVFRYARSLLDSMTSDPATYAVMGCAAYLHDCGMALPPRVINNLQLNEEDIDPRVLDKLKAKLGLNYSDYFRGSVFRLPNQDSLDEQDAMVIRILHPFISAAYIRREFNDKLSIRSLTPDTKKDLVEAIATIVEQHSSSVQIKDQVKMIGGYNVDLGYLSRVLRLADAMDFSRKRAEFVYEVLLFDLIQGKRIHDVTHWVFKMAVEDVFYMPLGKKVQIVLNGSDPITSKVQLLGLLFFEIFRNFMKDFMTFYSKYPVGLSLLFNGTEVNLVLELANINSCASCIETHIRRDKLEQFFESVQRKSSCECAQTLLEALKAGKEVSLYDSLGQLLAFSNIDFFKAQNPGCRSVMDSLIKLALEECPCIRRFLQKFNLG